MRRSIAIRVVFAAVLLGPGSGSASGGGGNPPSITAPAVASPASTTQSTSVSMGATDPAGEPSLRYSWSSTGPKPVTFADNGTNSAKNTTVTFFAAGSYVLHGRATNPDGLSVSTSVTVTVTQVSTAVAISPQNASVPKSSIFRFTASTVDQFGAPMGAQQAITWSVTGGGTIAADGTFTAGPTASGPFTVTAMGAGFTATTTVTVTVGVPPTVARNASSVPSSPVTVSSVVLDVLGADDGGEPSLLYSWVALGPGPVTFSDNNSNSAKKTTASFAQGGSYKLTVTVTDVVGLQNSSVITIEVVQKLAVIEIAPGTATVNAGAGKPFSATIKDQFNHIMTIDPMAIRWTATGGTAAAGQFTAGPRNGTFQVTATLVNVSGVATVTVVGGVDGPPVTWLSPSANEVVSGQVPFFVALASSSAKQVDFRLDGSIVGTVKQAPWMSTLDVRKFGNGKHAMVAVVLDAAGNSAESDPLAFEIDNSRSSRVTAADSCSTTGAAGLSWLLLPALLVLLRKRAQSRQGIVSRTKAVLPGKTSTDTVFSPLGPTSRS